jgi:serine O-acetyltransferase
MAASAKNTLMRKYYSLKVTQMSQRTMIQIPYNTKIGEGFYIGHLGRIIINEESVIGRNVNVATGVVIGKEYRGKREGAPKIGNKVWIGANAVVVGGITIGDDVLIAPLSFVNFDVPSHSIVIGNPAKIIACENATEGYINNTVES